MTIELTHQQAFIARLMTADEAWLKKTLKHIRNGARLVLEEHSHLTLDNASELLESYDKKYVLVPREALRVVCMMAKDQSTVVARMLISCNITLKEDEEARRTRELELLQQVTECLSYSRLDPE